MAWRSIIGFYRFWLLLPGYRSNNPPSWTVQLWGWRCRERFILKILRRWHEQSDLDSHTREILDIGCGDALFFPKLKQFGTVSGVEPNTELINPDNPNCADIYTGNIDETFAPQKRFDWVILLDVLEHIEQPADVLRHLCKHVNPGAQILMTVPAFNSLWTRHDDYNHHFTRYNKKTFAGMADGTGIRIDKMKYFFHWTFPAKVLVLSLIHI